MRTSRHTGHTERSSTWAKFAQVVPDEEALLATFETRGKVQEVERSRDEGALQSLYAAEEKLKVEHNKMLDLYSQDIITLAQLQERLALIRKKQESVTETKSEVIGRMERRHTATATTEALRAYCKQVREGMARAEQSTGGVDYRREFLEMLETRIVVGETEIEISGIITGKLPLFEAADAPKECLLRSGYVTILIGEGVERAKVESQEYDRYSERTPPSASANHAAGAGGGVRYCILRQRAERASALRGYTGGNTNLSRLACARPQRSA